MRCPLDFIVGSAAIAKVVCKLVNITVVCRSLDTVTLFYGTEDLHTRRECIIVVCLHTRKKCLSACTPMDSIWIFVNELG